MKSYLEAQQFFFLTAHVLPMSFMLNFHGFHKKCCVGSYYFFKTVSAGCYPVLTSP